MDFNAESELKIEFKEFYLNCMIDTGAHVSMIPAEFGVAIGLNIKRGEPLFGYRN